VVQYMQQAESDEVELFFRFGLFTLCDNVI
jgi:hypothetical protein